MEDTTRKMPQLDSVSVQVSNRSSSTISKSLEPKNRLTYVSQVIAIYFVLAVSIVQLCLESKDPIWLILLSSTLGYILPTPTLKFIKPGVLSQAVGEPKP